MNTLHTPGAWVCLDGKVFSDGFTTETPIATVHKRKSPHVTLANARLITAAPELLAVTQAFRRKLATYVSVYPGDKELRRLLGECDAAIAKSTGAAS